MEKRILSSIPNRHHFLRPRTTHTCIDGKLQRPPETAFDKIGVALKMWDILVDKKKCTGCRECVDACPGEVYELVAGKAVAANTDKCHGCHTCEEVCPEQAITVEDE